jgi:hypothetical protein
MAKDKKEEVKQERKIVAIPVAWMIYSLPANAFEIMGASVQQPPLIVADAGMGARVRKVETGIEIEDEEVKEGGPWFSEA